jgi:hypothetical protein
MSLESLPCCATAEPIRICELTHVYGFDFDLFQCPVCSQFWVWAWFNVGGWEPVTDADVKTMRELDGDALRVFMKQWAEKFN